VTQGAPLYAHPAGCTKVLQAGEPCGAASGDIDWPFSCCASSLSCRHFPPVAGRWTCQPVAAATARPRRTQKASTAYSPPMHPNTPNFPPPKVVGSSRKLLRTA
jgi:hypothetical protein